MSKPIAMALIALALATGFLGGIAVPRPAHITESLPPNITEAKMTPYERGRLVVQCNELSGYGIPGKPSPREACLEAIGKLP